MKKTKYGSRKTTIDGIKFDSVKEARRYQELNLLQRAGKISHLQLQRRYLLIPAQYETVNGKRRCIERECSYIADFVYYQDGKLIVEDAKGIRTKDYILKRKMMLFFHGIKITEV